MKILTIVGPTAVGKTSLAVKIAQQVNGEIVSADSRQIYHNMAIGTAQPTSTQRHAVPFHFIDIIDPDQVYSCGQFARDAESMINSIFNRNCTPIVCGGTGLYVKALFEPLHMLPESDKEIKERLVKEISLQGIDVLYARIKKIDPDWAEKIGPHDTQRIIRGLEVYELTGMTLSQLISEEKRKPLYTPCYIGLSLPRELLYRRINERFDAMIDQGLLEEVHALVDQGYDTETNALRTIGYREIIDHIQGRISLPLAIEKAKRRTRNFAKRQSIWFRKIPHIQWYDARDPGLTRHLIENMNVQD